MRKFSAARVFLCCFFTYTQLMGPALASEFALQKDPGMLIKGSIDEPSGFNSGILAVIIPGTHSYNRDGKDPSDPQAGAGAYYDLSHALQNQGINVVRFDAPLKLADHPVNPGENQTEEIDPSLSAQRTAILTITEHFRRQPGKYRKIIFIGHSQGGIIGAQLASAHRGLIDGLFTYGIPIRPMREAAIFAAKNIRVNAIRSLMKTQADGCVENSTISSDAVKSTLFALNPFIDFWMAPDNRWCEANLHEFEKRADLVVSGLLNAEKNCLHMDSVASASNSPTEAKINNSCEEILLFTSNQSIATMLEDFSGVVGIAMGTKDPLLSVQDERSYFSRLSRKFPEKRTLKLIDGAGHAFGEHPYMSPPNEKYLEIFAKFVASSMNIRHLALAKTPSQNGGVRRAE